MIFFDNSKFYKINLTVKKLEMWQNICLHAFSYLQDEKSVESKKYCMMLKRDIMRAAVTLAGLSLSPSNAVIELCSDTMALSRRSEPLG